MRETRQSGSEGGGGNSPYPYHEFREFRMQPVMVGEGLPSMDFVSSAPQAVMVGDGLPSTNFVSSAPQAMEVLPPPTMTSRTRCVLRNGSVLPLHAPGGTSRRVNRATHQ